MLLSSFDILAVDGGSRFGLKRARLDFVGDAKDGLRGGIFKGLDDRSRSSGGVVLRLFRAGSFMAAIVFCKMDVEIMWGRMESHEDSVYPRYGCEEWGSARSGSRQVNVDAFTALLTSHTGQVLPRAQAAENDFIEPTQVFTLISHLRLSQHLAVIILTL